MCQGIKTGLNINPMWGYQQESGIWNRKYGYQQVNQGVYFNTDTKKRAQQLLCRYELRQPQYKRRHADFHSVCCKKQQGKTLLAPIHEVTRREIVSEVHHQVSKCSHRTKSLVNSPKITSSKSRTSHPIRMVVLIQEENQEQLSGETQVTPQRPRKKTRTCLKFIQDVITCCDLVHHYDGASTFNNQHMYYTPGGIHPGLSLCKYQVQHIHDDYTRYWNQEKKQDKSWPQALQEPIWAEARI